MENNKPQFRLSVKFVANQLLIIAIIVGFYWLSPDIVKFLTGLAVGITLHAFYQQQRITLAIQLIVIILSFVIGAKMFG